MTLTKSTTAPDHFQTDAYSASGSSPPLTPAQLARLVADLSADQRRAFDAAERMVTANGKSGDQLDREARERLKGRFATPALADGVTAASIQWLWDGFVPLGALSLLYGPEGLGKSTLTALIAAKATTGTLPGALHGQPARVEIVAYEDDPAAVLRPRLEAAGADLSRVYLHGDTGTGDALLTLPDDVDAFGAAVEDRGSKLVIVDPLPDALREGLKDNNNGDVRRAIVPLHRWATSAGVAVLGVTHPNKGATNAADKVMGSKAWRSVPRSVLLYGSDPSDPDGDSRIVAVSKANYAAKRAAKIDVRSVKVPGVAGTQPAAKIAGDSDYTDADLMLANAGASRPDPVKGRGGQQAAAEALIYRLLEQGGGSVEAATAYAAGEAAGIGEATMRRARRAVGCEGRGTWTLEGLPV